MKLVILAIIVGIAFAISPPTELVGEFHIIEKTNTGGCNFGTEYYSIHCMKNDYGDAVIKSRKGVITINEDGTGTLEAAGTFSVYNAGMCSDTTEELPRVPTVNLDLTFVSYQNNILNCSYSMFGQTYYFTPIFELDGKNVKTFKLAYGDPNVGDSYISSYFPGLVYAVEPCCRDCPANVDASGTYCVSIGEQDPFYASASVIAPALMMLAAVLFML